MRPLDETRRPVAGYRALGGSANVDAILAPLIVDSPRLVQVLGTLNNLTALDLPKGIGWVDVLSNYALAPFLTKLLVPGMAQNDVVLEVRFLHQMARFAGRSCHGLVRALLCVDGRRLHSAKGTDSLADLEGP